MESAKEDADKDNKCLNLNYKRQDIIKATAHFLNAVAFNFYRPQKNYLLNV
jgi:hypothetical protein